MKNSLLADITTRLTPISDSPALDASVLLGHIIGKPRSWILAHSELTLTTEQNKELTKSLSRLEQGEAFPYVIGHWEFFGLDLSVTPDVLIPRPETELLVEKAIAWLDQNPNRRNIADVGTGSGAIAIALAKNIPKAKILATDISSRALQVAKQNAEKHGVLNIIKFVECDLLPHPFSPLPVGEGLGVREIDLLCANLPYIPTAMLRNLSVFGREPTLALDGGPDGFTIIRKLLQIVSGHLTSNSLILFEIEETLGKEAISLAHQFFSDAKIELHKDLTGHNRLLEIQPP